MYVYPEIIGKGWYQKKTRVSVQWTYSTSSFANPPQLFSFTSVCCTSQQNMLYTFFFSLTTHHTLSKPLLCSSILPPLPSDLHADLVLNLNFTLAPLLSPGSFTYFSSFNCFFTAAYRSRVFLLCTSSNHLCLHFLFRLLPHFSIRRCSYHIFFFRCSSLCDYYSSIQQIIKGN